MYEEELLESTPSSDQNHLLNLKNKKIHNYAILQHDSSEDDSNVNYKPINKTSRAQSYEKENNNQNLKIFNIHQSISNKPIIEELPKPLEQNGFPLKITNKSFADLITESTKQIDKINHMLEDHRKKKIMSQDGDNMNKEKSQVPKYYLKNDKIEVILSLFICNNILEPNCIKWSSLLIYFH